MRTAADGIDARLIPFKDTHLLPPSPCRRGVVDLAMPGVADRGFGNGACLSLMVSEPDMPDMVPLVPVSRPSRRAQKINHRVPCAAWVKLGPVPRLN